MPGTESPAVPVWDLLGPPALPSATPTASAVRTCPRRNPGGVRPSLAPTARLVRLLRSAASGPVQPPPRATVQARWQLASGFQRKSGPQANLKAAIRVWAGPRAASTSIPSQWRARHTEHLLAPNVQQLASQISESPKSRGFHHSPPGRPSLQTRGPCASYKVAAPATGGTHRQADLNGTSDW